MGRIKIFILNNYWFSIGILLSLILILLWFSSLGEYQFRILFSSDALYLPSIYEDIFVNGNSIQGWMFNPAPNFVPDMLLFFILMGITSNFLTATFLFSIIQYFVIIALFYLIFKKISNITSAFFSLSIYLFSFFLLYFLIDNNFYNSFLILSNAYHNGMLVMTLICVLLSIHFFKKESWTTLSILFVLSAISFPCDKLFLVMYTVPIIACLGALFIAGYSKRKIFKLLICSILSFLFGMVISDKFNHNSVFRMTVPHQYLTIESIMDSWNMFYSQMKEYLTEISFISLTIILSIITYIWTIYYCLTEFIAVKRKKIEISLLFIFQLFVLFFIPILLFAPIMNGNYMGWDCIRYNYFVFIVLLFNLILLTNHYLTKQKLFIIGLNSLFSISLSVFLLWNICKIDFTHQLANYFTFYPQDARNLDKQFPTNNETVYGITDDYWYAKHATMFSKNNIQLRATFYDAVPYLHVSNEKWYFGGGNANDSNPQFTFLLWSSSEKLPDFFIEQNPPYKSQIIDRHKTLHFVKSFVYTQGQWTPHLLHESQEYE